MFEVGDKVVSAYFGEGEVVVINSHREYPVSVKFQKWNNPLKFTLCGVYDLSDPNSSDNITKLQTTSEELDSVMSEIASLQKKAESLKEKIKEENQITSVKSGDVFEICGVSYIVVSEWDDEWNDSFRFVGIDGNFALASDPSRTLKDMVDYLNTYGAKFVKHIQFAEIVKPN